MAIVRSDEAKGLYVQTVIMIGHWSENLIKQLRQLPSEIVMKDLHASDYNCLAIRHEKAGMIWEIMSLSDSKISPKAQHAFSLFASKANLVLLCPESSKHSDKLSQVEAMLLELSAISPLNPSLARTVVRWHAAAPKGGYSAITTPLVLPQVPKAEVPRADILSAQRKNFFFRDDKITTS